jgi:ABC-type glycerol-3-phosphate transport system substrate-binding protein
MAPAERVTTTVTGPATTVTQTVTSTASATATTRPSVTLDVFMGHLNWVKQLNDGMRKHPRYSHITLEPVDSGGLEAQIAMMSRTCGTADSPAIVNWHCGRDLDSVVRKKCIAPLDDVWEPAKQHYDDHVFLGVTVDDHIYGVPAQDSQEVAVYNLPLFDEMGLNKWPETWDQFENVVEALAEAGLDYPIGQNNGDSWPAFYWFTYLYLFMNGPDAYNELCLGERKYTDSESLDAFEFWADMIGKGWFGPDPSKNNAMSSTTAPPLWRDGQIGMMLLPITVIKGWWPDLAKDDIVHSFALPPLNGSPGGKQVFWYIWPFVANAGNPNLEDVKLVYEYWLTKEGADIYNEVSGLNNPHKLADPNNFIWQYSEFWEELPKKGFKRAFDSKGQPAFRFWEATASEIHMEIPQAMGRMWESKSPDYKAVAAECERIASAHWKSV